MSFIARSRAAVLPLTTLALFTMAGCASEPAADSASPPPAPVAPPDDGNHKPGTYSVIDGKDAPIPAIHMGDPATVARIIDEGVKRNHVMDQITYISTTIGARLTGSSNAEKANKWGRDQFEKWGLSIPPFGGAEGQTSGDHDLRGLWQWGQISLRFDRGPCSAKILAPRNAGSENPEYRTVRDMEFTSPAWTVGTNGPVRGKVVKMPENDQQFEAIKDSVKGAWILTKPNEPGRRGVIGGAGVRQQVFADIRKKWKSGQSGEVEDKDITHYQGTMTGGPARGDGMQFTLDVKLTDPKNVTGTFSMGGFRNSTISGGTFNVDTHELKFTTESPRGSREYVLMLEGDTLKGKTELPDNGGEIAYNGKKVSAEELKKGPELEEKLLALQPAGWITSSSNELVITGGAPGWDKLDLDNLNPDIIVTVRQSDYDCMNSRLADGLPVEAEFDLQHSFTKGPIPVYDTIAEIKGTMHPEEVVIVSGHLDSWNGPGSQGTTDNGTGSAVTLEAARILSAVKAKPKRTIRFILWTGEEQGLLGSVAYVKYLKDHNQLERVSAVLVDDGGTNWEGGLPCVPNEVDYLAAATAPVNGRFYSEADKKFMDVNIHREDVFNQVMGSDHNSFMREHIPGFFWDEVGRADYNHTHHTQYDRLDQAIPEYLVQSATCMAVTAYNLACAPEMLPRPTDDQWPQGGGGRRGGGGGGGGGQRGRGGQGGGGQGGGGQGGGQRPGGGGQ
jgi:hypothetical protein